MKILILLLFPVLSHAATAQETYTIYIQKKSEALFELKKNLPGICQEDLNCMQTEIQKLGFQSSTAYPLATAVLAVSVMKMKEKFKPCDDSCKSAITALMVEQSLILARKIRINEYFSRTLPATDPYSLTVQATEEFITYRTFIASKKKLSELLSKADLNLIKDPELKKRAQMFSAEIQAMPAPSVFQGRMFDSIPVDRRKDIFNELVGRDEKRAGMIAELRAFQDYLKTIPK